MVGSINPSTTGALGVDTRPARSQLTLPTRREDAGGIQDKTDALNEARAMWRAAQDSVTDGVAALDLALAAGREALSRLNEIGSIARDGGDAQPALDAFRKGLELARSSLLQGGAVEVSAEPGGGRITVEGVDLTALRLPAKAGDVDPATLARLAQDSAALVQQHLTRLETASRSLETHARFITEAAGSIGVRTDVDADGARLMALQVRQGLEGADLAIVNASPQDVLALFKS
jgi:hypothetical protein